jgi:hypothetical protein
MDGLGRFQSIFYFKTCSCSLCINALVWHSETSYQTRLGIFYLELCYIYSGAFASSFTYDFSEVQLLSVDSK